MKNPYELVFALVLLTGCGGSGDGGPPLDIPSDLRSTPSALELVERYQDSTFTELATLPTSGFAEFEGYAGLNLRPNSGEATTSIIGELDLIVNFDNPDNFLEGEIRNLEADGGAQISGDIEVVDGAFERQSDTSVEPSVSGQLIGSTIFPGGVTYDFALRLEGDFRGRNGDGLGGNLIGQYESDEGDGLADGTFIVER